MAELRGSEGTFSHSLWTISVIDACGSFFMLFMVLFAAGRMSKLVEAVDRSAVTMADYTVIVQPVGEWTAYSALDKVRFYAKSGGFRTKNDGFCSTNDKAKRPELLRDLVRFVYKNEKILTWKMKDPLKDDDE